jgi:hypothetical protein
MATLTNLDDVKRTLALGTNTNGTLVFDKHLDDTLITEHIQQASDFFILKTGNNYYGTQGTLVLDVAEPYVCGRKLYFVDDVFRSITRIENDGQGTLTSADWVTIPRNSTPYWGVQLKSKSWAYDDTRLGAIKVIGALGENADGQPSPRVHLAVTQLASWLYQTRDTRGSIQLGAQSSRTSNTDIPNLVWDAIDNERRFRIHG